MSVKSVPSLSEYVSPLKVDTNPLSEHLSTFACAVCLEVPTKDTLRLCPLKCTGVICARCFHTCYTERTTCISCRGTLHPGQPFRTWQDLDIQLRAIIGSVAVCCPWKKTCTYRHTYDQPDCTSLALETYLPQWSTLAQKRKLLEFLEDSTLSKRPRLTDIPTSSLSLSASLDIIWEALNARLAIEEMYDNRESWEQCVRFFMRLSDSREFPLDWDRVWFAAALSVETISIDSSRIPNERYQTFILQACRDHPFEGPITLEKVHAVYTARFRACSDSASWHRDVCTIAYSHILLFISTLRPTSTALPSADVLEGCRHIYTELMTTFLGGASDDRMDNLIDRVLNYNTEDIETVPRRIRTLASLAMEVLGVNL